MFVLDVRVISVSVVCQNDFCTKFLLVDVHMYVRSHPFEAVHDYRKLLQIGAGVPS